VLRLLKSLQDLEQQLPASWPIDRAGRAIAIWQSATSRREFGRVARSIEPPRCRPPRGLDITLRPLLTSGLPVAWRPRFSQADR
jgi:hypothetical protein